MTNEAGNPTGGAPPPPGPPVADAACERAAEPPAQGPRGEKTRILRAVSNTILITFVLSSLLSHLAGWFGSWLTFRGERIKVDLEQLKYGIDLIRDNEDLDWQVTAMALNLIEEASGMEIEPPLPNTVELFAELAKHGKLDRQRVVVSASANGFAFKRGDPNERAIYIHNDSQVRNLFFLIDLIDWEGEHQPRKPKPLILCKEERIETRIGELRVDQDLDYEWVVPEELSAVFLYNPNDIGVRQASIWVCTQKDYPDSFRHGSVYWLTANPKSIAHIREVVKGKWPDSDSQFIYKHSVDINPVIVVTQIKRSDQENLQPLELRGDWMDVADDPLRTLEIREHEKITLEPLKEGQRLYLYNPNDLALELKIAVRTR